jgi:hypothetical protein
MEGEKAFDFNTADFRVRFAFVALPLVTITATNAGLAWHSSFAARSGKNPRKAQRGEDN